MIKLEQKQLRAFLGGIVGQQWFDITSVQNSLGATVTKDNISLGLNAELTPGDISAGARRPCNGCKRRLHLQIK
jgi:hypothetical protein